MAHLLCDRCSVIYQPHPDWPRSPLCRACLIALRITETTDTAPRMITTRELETAWRHHLLKLTTRLHQAALNFEEPA